MRYARGLLLAAGEKNLEELAENLDIAAEVLSEERVAEFLGDPQTSENTKAELIEKAFADNPLLINLLKIVVNNRKVREIGNIAESFRTVLSEAAGVATAEIESATPLAEKQLSELTAALRKFTGKDVTTNVTENPKLLGGVKIYLGDELIDLSLAGKLRKLEKVLSGITFQSQARHQQFADILMLQLFQIGNSLLCKFHK
ncbi:ATP synthase F1 subunit delta [Candidatus Gracilibacteria bacterium]|nr:ATP synthase F1 subunit delta [Candidatus Gracilibacteria bacterium]